jgi:hypothetical protein
MSRDDLQADLLADLAPRIAPAPPAPVEPDPLPPELEEKTPVLSLSCTPLRWSRPRVARASDGVGKALRLGPLTVELAVKES